MTAIDEKLISGLLQHYYGITSESMVLVRRKPDRQLWKVIDTGKNVYAFKYLEKSARAPLIVAVNNYIHGKGIPVTIVLPKLDGTSIVAVDDGCFLLFQWQEGSQPDYADNDMIKKMAMLLAEFHVASQGYAGSGNPITDSRLDWNQIYQRKIKKMKKCQKNANKSGDLFSASFLSHLPWIQSRINWVLDRLPHTGLSALLDAARQDPHLAHGDYSPLNILCSKNKELTIIDFDTTSIALPMRDISHLITWINHELGAWSSERFKCVVDAYQQIHPLSSEEYELLLLDQIFPHKAIRLSEKYFKGSGSSKMLKGLERCIEIDKAKLTDLGMGPKQ
ncbi:hypothetical protein D0469_11415 [Peribacillus saganii]|uniref:Aminoglycoside phosphotransferase domain-containing protein n=1 Tax=Peribacillus saganii TaxID=2303992 RepID=A0A372LND2_9BACI|nr:phosphotransferase [Peribacillus saganii]RFU68737.1 hypothetical protein D0469_11415 [Peribacillus saganii]